MQMSEVETNSTTEEWQEVVADAKEKLLDSKIL